MRKLLSQCSPGVSLQTFHTTLILTLSDPLYLNQIQDFEERLAILADCQKLKFFATAYLHPEAPVKSYDATASARCYFDRPSAAQIEDQDLEEERAQILADAAALKKLAIEYLHPENPVVCTDSTATARNYFTRPSAYDVEDEDERAVILAEAAALKKLAVDYMHPEKPVVCTDVTATARNYFGRASAVVDEYADERATVLAEAAALKKLAVDYMHPEKPVVCTDATATARNYFTRPSAYDVEVEDADERVTILAEAAALKKLAVDYMHPEKSVICVDSTACARNYFTRPSALHEAEFEGIDQVLTDVAALKQLASDYMHPERPVTCTDSAARGRSYFKRSSSSIISDFEERAQVLADAAALKKLAVDYLHPELPVVCNDPTATARCYFDRVSSPDQEHPAVHAASSPSFDEEVVEDIRQTLTKFERSHSFGQKQATRILSKEEEGHLSRSPSSVMLFDLGGTGLEQGTN